MDFVSVRTATLRGDQKIDFDVYVLVNGKYITFLRKGDSFEGARLERLKKKNLKKMYIRSEDETSYRGYISRNIDNAFDKNSTQSADTRSEVVHGVLHAGVEAVIEDPSAKEAYEAAKNDAGRFVDFLLNGNDLVKSMLAIENADKGFVHHSVNVSTLSVAIAQGLGMKDPKALQFLALGALLHDLGHTGTAFQGVTSLALLSNQDKINYMKHSMAGGELARDKRHFDPVVVSIIVQHEELVDGSGYPAKLPEKLQDPLSVIVSTANDFDRYSLSAAKPDMPKSEIVKQFTMERIGLHPLEHFKILKSIALG